MYHLTGLKGRYVDSTEMFTVAEKLHKRFGDVPINIGWEDGILDLGFVGIDFPDSSIVIPFLRKIGYEDNRRRFAFEGRKSRYSK